MSFANDDAPTQDELEGYTLVAYRNAWGKRYGVEKSDFVIEVQKLARITLRIAQFARKRRIDGETFGAAYRRTADQCMAVWLAKDGNNNTSWLVERCHALAILSDGTRQSPDSELDWVVSTVARKDRNRTANALNHVKPVLSQMHVPTAAGGHVTISYTGRPNFSDVGVAS